MASSDLLWLDSDILLDWMCARSPWDAAATELIERAINGEWRLIYSPLTLANIFYIYRKLADTQKALRALVTLSHTGMIADMTGLQAHTALASGRQDFEDELQIACAESVPGLTSIITRNLTDYAHCRVSVMTAADWLATHPLKDTPSR